MRARLATCSANVDSPSMLIGPNHTLMARILRGSLTVLGLSWICFASTLCGCNSVNGYVMNESGKAYYKRGDYTAARHEFERALMDSPENSNYAYNVAAAMQQQGDVMAAEKMYQHALVIDPGHEQSYEGLAHLLYNNDRTTEAEQLLTAWSETQPYDEDSSLTLARMQENLGNTSAADLAYDRALAANPTSSRLNQELGRRRRRAGHSDSELAYQRGMMQNPYGAPMQAEAQSPALLMAQQMPLYDPTLQPAAMPFANYSPAAGYGAGANYGPVPAAPTAPYIGSANVAQQAPPSIYQGIHTPSTATMAAPSFAWGTPATVPMPPSALSAGGMLAAQPAYAPSGTAFFNGAQAPAWSAPIATSPMMAAPTMMAPQFAPAQVLPASGAMPMVATPSSYGGLPGAPMMPQPQVVPAF